ncbi:MAG: type I DNA topoisomerase [Peptococcaceae bacterium]|nr:type I DNA topoisomerase [Peptococcaceae bacterium]
MGKTLVIVESPSKAKTIEKFLGKNYEVLASLGHVRDLPKSQFGIDVENDFEVKYITIRGKGDKIKELKKAASKADRVLLASDPDREGEAIAWTLMETLKINPEEKCRIEFNEITKEAVKTAVKHPRQLAYNRVYSQQARRVLDRFIGYQLSPLLWRKVKKGLSAGRVQSVTVRMICEREEEINSFIPEEYWTLDNVLSTGSSKMTAKLSKISGKKAEIGSEAEMQAILDDLKGASYEVADLKVQKKTKNPAAPFITSSMQQDAYRKMNFTAKKTMRVAQQLYEGISLGKGGTVGLITYMRTDSTRIADVAKADAAAFIKERYGEQYLPKEQKAYKNKNNAQNAHEAIRPTYVDKTPESIKEYLSNEQYKLYKLIWERFVASQMASAQLEQTTILTRSGKYDFTTSGTIVTFKGYMEVYEESKEEDGEENQKLVPVEIGQSLKSEKLIPKQHFTQPPARYTEATLIKALEEKGIGRPSTYAPTVETVLARNYVVREAKQFYPTELGILVVDLLKEHFPDIIDVNFTAGMEDKLDGIEEGEYEWKAVVRDFYEPFSRELAAAEEKIGQIKIEDEVSDEICEKCGRNMVIKMGRFGKFLACPGFPECSNAKPLLEKIDVTCPVCGKGDVVLRRSKKGRTFYGCSDYPECSFVSWDRPTGQRCPKCDSIMVERNTKKGKLVICSNKECNFEPVEQSDNQES